MSVPPEFSQLGRCFHQDITKDAGQSASAVVFEAISIFAQQTPERSAGSPSPNLVVKQFLTQLLENRTSEVELKKIWFASGANEMVLVDGKVANFLRMIRDAL